MTNLKRNLFGLLAVVALAGGAASASADDHRGGGHGARHGGHRQVQHRPVAYYAPVRHYPRVAYVPVRPAYHHGYYRPVRPVAYYPAPYYGSGLQLSFNFR